MDEVCWYGYSITCMWNTGNDKYPDSGPERDAVVPDVDRQGHGYTLLTTWQRVPCAPIASLDLVFPTLVVLPFFVIRRTFICTHLLVSCRHSTVRDTEAATDGASCGCCFRHVTQHVFVFPDITDDFIRSPPLPRDNGWKGEKSNAFTVKILCVLLRFSEAIWHWKLVKNIVFMFTSASVCFVVLNVKRSDHIFRKSSIGLFTIVIYHFMLLVFA